MRSKRNARTKTSSASNSAAAILKPKVLNDGSFPEASGRPNLARHAANCKICHHALREEIERDFIDWRSPAKIAREFGLRDRSSIYRHAHKFKLFGRRRRNLRVSLEYIIEHASDVDVNASAVVAAVQVCAKINGRGLLVERDEHLALHDLFDRMSPEEYDTYAKEATLPRWFRDAIAAAGGRVPKKDEDE
jgi:hypothetical protein